MKKRKMQKNEDNREEGRRVSFYLTHGREREVWHVRCALNGT